MAYDIDRGSGGLITDFNNVEKLDNLLKTGDKVRIKHYSVPEYIITDVVDVNEREIKIRVTNNLVKYNVFPGDRIMVIFMVGENEECLIDGVIEKAVIAFPQFFVVKQFRIRRFKDARKNRRYELNVCGNISLDEKEYYCCVKNISMAGCKMITKANIEEDKNFKIDLFLGHGKNAMVDVGIVRKKRHMNFNEYGLAILKTDQEGRKHLAETIELIKEKEKA